MGFIHVLIIKWSLYVFESQRSYLCGGMKPPLAKNTRVYKFFFVFTCISFYCLNQEIESLFYFILKVACLYFRVTSLFCIWNQVFG